MIIKVNDIFDELSDENKRLNEELIFANNCLKVLNKFKLILNKIYVKYETTIESEDKQELKHLDEELNYAINGRHSKSLTNGEVVQQIGVNRNNTESDKTFNRRSGRTEQKIYFKHKTYVKRDSNKKSEIKPKPLPTVIPDPKEEPNSMLLLKRDNFDPKTKSYVCPNPECHKCFETIKKLQRHFQYSHHLKATHVCHHQNCNKSFKRECLLKIHSLSHSDIRPYGCPVNDCSFRCKFLGALKRHSLSHTNIRPYQCSDCLSTYKSEMALKRHHLLHKNLLSIKCYVEGCHQAFSREYYLEKHKKLVHNIHRKVKTCDWPGCDYQTVQSVSYNNHRTIHTGEKPYLCQWPGCDRRFRLKDNLNKHLLVHKDLKPKACVWPGCQYRCRTTANMNTHLKVHKKVYSM